MRVIDYKKVSLSNIRYHEPVKTAGGCLISRTYYKYKSEEIPIYIQTPRLKVNSNLEILDSKTYLELELDKKHINFYEFINNIDDQNIRETYKNSEDWFQEKLPMDVVDDFYKTNIKMRKYNKSPIVKFKIPLYKNSSRKSCDIFGDDLKPVDVSEIKQNTDVICILELEGIKFFKQRFETEWKVVQLRVYKPKEEVIPCLINESFLSDNEDTQNNDPFPEDGISLNSSIASDIVDTDVSAVKEIPEEEIIKNISIQVPNVNTTNSINVEKVEGNISLEITPPKTNNNDETLGDTIVAEDGNEDENGDGNKDGNENGDGNEDENEDRNEDEDGINTSSITKTIEIPDTIGDMEENTNHNREENESTEIESDNEENNYSQESEVEDEDDLDSMNEDSLDNYFSDNFTDEEEICDGLENNLEEVNFLHHNTKKSSNLKNPNTLEEEVNLENSNTEKLDKQNENLEEYQNKTIQELIDEITKFKKIALDRENEMSELKSKYKNLYSELNL